MPGKVVGNRCFCCSNKVSGAIEKRYQGEAGRIYHEGKRAVPAKAYPWVARLRAKKFQPYIERTDAVLEIGVGLGWNLAELRCGRRVGTDLENFLPEDVKLNGVEFSPSSSNFPNESFDVVICHHVLEHVERPTEMLAEIQRLLRTGGKLLMHVPFEKERRYLHFDPQEPNHHLFSWNVQTLGNLLTDTGFAVESAGLGEFGFDRAAAVWALRMGFGENGFHLLRRVAHLYGRGQEVRIRAVRG
jgi:SAM-dependent methyltransferase